MRQIIFVSTEKKARIDNINENLSSNSKLSAIDKKLISTIKKL